MEKVQRNILKKSYRKKQPKLYRGEFYPWYTRVFHVAKPKYPINGNCEFKFASVEAEFCNNFLQGKEVGASVSIFTNGQCNVELYGGYANFEKKIPFSESTLQLVFSCSKVLESLGIACMVDRGLLKYEDKVCSYWPEFGNNGKDHVTIADLMRHEGGSSYFLDPQPSFTDLQIPEKRRKIVANQKCIFEKGIRSYHAVNRGFITNELVQLVDPSKRTLGRFYREEINKPLDVEFYLGLEPSLYSRRSKWYNYPLLDTIFGLVFPNSSKGKHILADFDPAIIKKGSPFGQVIKMKNKEKDFENSEVSVIEELPSANGFTNAKTLATIGASLANGGELNGYRLISSSGLEQALGEPTTAFDVGLLKYTTMTRAGFGVFKFLEFSVETQFYGWCGMGGSLFLFNPEYRFSFSYVMNGANLTTLLGSKAKSLFILAFKTHLASLP